MTSSNKLNQNPIINPNPLTTKENQPCIVLIRSEWVKFHLAHLFMGLATHPNWFKPIGLTHIYYPTQSSIVPCIPPHATKTPTHYPIPIRPYPYLKGWILIQTRSTYKSSSFFSDFSIITGSHHHHQYQNHGHQFHFRNGSIITKIWCKINANL